MQKHDFEMDCEKQFPILKKLVPNKTMIRIIPLNKRAEPIVGLYEDHCGRYISFKKSDSTCSRTGFFSRIKSIELL